MPPRRGRAAGTALDRSLRPPERRAPGAPGGISLYHIILFDVILYVLIIKSCAFAAVRGRWPEPRVAARDSGAGGAGLRRESSVRRHRPPARPGASPAGSASAAEATRSEKRRAARRVREPEGPAPDESRVGPLRRPARLSPGSVEGSSRSPSASGDPGSIAEVGYGILASDGCHGGGKARRAGFGSTLLARAARSRFSRGLGAASLQIAMIAISSCHGYYSYE